jgi:NAD(P)-dependent dehydrogenase (short-subunit alcohol dehydrogenase family)
MRDPAAFGPATTTDEALDGLDLRGRTALITGGSSGLGKETARALAARGATVVLTARDVPKGEKVADEIRASTGNAAVAVAELELGSLAAIRSAAERILAAHSRFDLLVNNAGVMACPFAKTTDGFELQFGSNHLGHFLFTLLMLPALRRGDAVRIVNLSSRGHHIAPVDFDDLHFERRPYDKWQSYGQAKTANVLFTVGLERRLARSGVTCSSRTSSTSRPGAAACSSSRSSKAPRRRASPRPRPSSPDAAASTSRTATSPRSTTRPTHPKA